MLSATAKGRFRKISARRELGVSSLAPLGFYVGETYRPDDVFVTFLRQSESFASFANGKHVFVDRLVTKQGEKVDDHLDRVAARAEFVRAARDRKAIVVIDRSREGSGLDFVRQPVADFCRKSNLLGDDVVFVSQNRLLSSELRAFEGTGAIVPRCMNFDWWPHSLLNRYESTEVDTPGSVAGVGLDQRLFLCINRRAKPHRLAVLSLLSSPEMDDLSYTSLLMKTQSCSLGELSLIHI